MRYLFSFFISTGMLLLMTGCGNASGKGVVHFTTCVEDEKGIWNFQNVLFQIASDYDLSIIDMSSQSETALGGIERRTVGEVPWSNHLLQISLMSTDGRALSATNIGLPKYQIYISIPERGKEKNSVSFSADVWERVATRWQTEAIPANGAAKPMEQCASH